MWDPTPPFLICTTSPANQWEELMKAKYKSVATLASIVLGAVAMMASGIGTASAQDTVRVRGTISL